MPKTEPDLDTGGGHSDILEGINKTQNEDDDKKVFVLFVTGKRSRVFICLEDILLRKSQSALML